MTKWKRAFHVSRGRRQEAGGRNVDMDTILFNAQKLEMHGGRGKVSWKKHKNEKMLVCNEREN